MAQKNKGIAFAEDDDSDRDSDRTDQLSSILGKLSIGPEKKNEKKLLVLCLGGLLVHRVHVGYDRKVPNRAPDATYGAYYVYKRPFCEEFMRFCLDRFEVGIWSSAMERNIDAVLNIIIEDLRGKLLFVMDQEDCIDSGFKALEKRDKPLFLKDLSKVFQKINRGVGKSQFSYMNTLLIDDRPYKALMNPINTGIFPAAYDPEDKDDNLLDPKGEFCSYLEQLMDAPDVRDYVRVHPFGQPIVDSSHPDWPFYSAVVRSRKCFQQLVSLFH